MVKLLKSIGCIATTLMLSVSMLPIQGYAATCDIKIQADAGQSSNKLKASSLRVTKLEIPTPGKMLSKVATVTSLEGYSWDIPVIWIDENGQVANGVAGKVNYRPVLAFFVPNEYELVGSEGSTELSIGKELTENFGRDKVLSIYNENSNITFIFIGNANELLVQGQKDKIRAGLSELMEGESASESDASAYQENGYESYEVAPASENTGENAQGKSEKDQEAQKKRYLEIHCAKTALDAFDEDSLYLLVNSIVNDIEPQAVKYLEEGFPAFAQAAQEGNIGKEIGFYVYYKNGDKDGIGSHMHANDNAMAYVSKNIINKDDDYCLGQMLAVNLSEFIRLDENGEYAVNKETGKYLAVESDPDLENTVVHEMLHAFMNDYNRVAMTGSLNAEEWFDESPEGMKKYRNTLIPLWLREGLASSVENVYQFRRDAFKLYRYEYVDAGDEIKGIFRDKFTKDVIREAYTTSVFELPDSEGNIKRKVYRFDIEMADKGYDGDTPAKYVSGYLASLYLGEMAAKNAGLGSSVVTDENGNNPKINNETVRLGINELLQRLHDGETLDSIINNISGGEYKDTDDFEKRFIKGYSEDVAFSNGTGTYKQYLGDDPSLSFCETLLNQMRTTEVLSEGAEYANGSVLMDFTSFEKSPIKKGAGANATEFVIVDSNDYVASSVDIWTDGGKSRTGKGETESETDITAIHDVIGSDVQNAAKDKQDENNETQAAEDENTKNAAETVETTQISEAEETVEAEATAEAEETEETADAKETENTAEEVETTEIGEAEEIPETEDAETDEAMEEAEAVETEVEETDDTAETEKTENTAEVAETAKIGEMEETVEIQEVAETEGTEETQEASETEETEETQEAEQTEVA